MVKAGDKIVLEISSLSSTGAGVGKIDGYVVFVKGALSGERVLAVVTSAKKTYATADTEEIMTQSPNRVAPVCRVKGCGGCPLKELAYAEQLKHKLSTVNETLRRIGGVDTACGEIIGMENPYHYRNKMVFHVQGGKIGFYAEGSHSIVPVSNCAISHKVNAKVIKTAGKSGEVLSEEILIRAAFNTEEVLARPHFGLWEVDYIHERLGKAVFRVSAESFFQVNTYQAEKLYQTALEFAAPDENTRVVDAYCGAGAIALYFAVHAPVASVTGIEINEKAVADAVTNAELNGVMNSEFICAPAESVLTEILAKGRATLVVDPPRAGCGKEFLRAVMENRDKIEKLVYVSCDTATLARDLRELCGAGFEVMKVTAVDMFPHTSSIETVTLLGR